MEDPQPISSSAPRRGWWSRNWKWFVPTGCLSLIALVAVFVGCLFVLIFGIMRSNDAYKMAVARAKSHSEVIAALGTPIVEGYFISGHTDVNGASGTADLAIPISGPKGKATIYVVAEKSVGQWNYSKLVVEIAGAKERIDLNATATEN